MYCTAAILIFFLNKQSLVIKLRKGLLRNLSRTGDGNLATSLYQELECELLRSAFG